MSNKTCPKCNTKNSIVTVSMPESLEIRNEEISLDISFLRCDACGEEYFDNDNDFLDAAYREYRQRHNMVQPEELKSFRSHYGLTQQELSSLLGWGGATISRYENGALQDEAHDKTLRLAMDPKNLKRLIFDNSNLLRQEKAESIISQIETEIQEQEQKTGTFDLSIFNKPVPGEYSGAKSLNVSKLINSILYLCSGKGELKTKLNKLLFYADFIHYKNCGVSITGAQYIKLQYGPVLDDYELYLAVLISKEQLSVEEKEFGDFLGDMIISNIDPNIGELEPSELEALAKTKGYFKDYSATKISKKAHKEKGYLETSELEPISYKYAADIELE